SSGRDSQFEDFAGWSIVHRNVSESCRGGRSNRDSGWLFRLRNGRVGEVRGPLQGRVTAYTTAGHHHSEGGPENDSDVDGFIGTEGQRKAHSHDDWRRGGRWCADRRNRGRWQGRGNRRACRRWRRNGRRWSYGEPRRLIRRRVSCHFQVKCSSRNTALIFGSTSSTPATVSSGFCFVSRMSRQRPYSCWIFHAFKL